MSQMGNSMAVDLQETEDKKTHGFPVLLLSSAAFESPVLR